MPTDIEARLREALHARAAEVEPDPRTWQRVQERLRRARLWRWTAAGAVAAAGIAAAVLLPGTLGPNVAFEPPVADQPGADEPAVEEPGQPEPGEPAGPPGDQQPAEPGTGASGPCTGTAATVAVLSRGGDLALLCASGDVEPLTSGAAVDRSPALSPTGDAVVFERRGGEAEETVLVHRVLGEGDRGEQVLGGGSLPAFAPDGRLARVQDDGDGRAFIVVSELFAEPDIEIEVQGPTPPVRVSGLAWDTGSDRLLYTTVDGDGVAQAWTIRADGGGRELLEPVADSFDALAVAADGTLAALSRRTADGELDLVTIDRSMLDGAGPDGVGVLTSLEGILDPQAGAPMLASAGAAAPPGTPAGGGWRAADFPSWFVSDGRALWLVQYDGTAIEVGAGVDGVGANPSAALPAADGTGAAGPGEGSGLRPQRGLPEEVEATRQALADAAAGGDVEALRERMADEFTYSFGASPDPDDAAAHLAGDPEAVGRIRDLLAVPHGVVRGGDAPLYVWPRAHALDPQAWTDADVDVLRSLGASEDDLAAWRGTGYTGPRLGIEADGSWRFLVAGD